MNVRNLLFSMMLLTFVNLSRAQESHPFYHFTESNSESKAWLALLPGSSGLEIFGDTTHYYSYAEEFSKQGYDVLTLDYKAAYRNAERKEEETTGEKILWVLNDAIEWAKENHLIKGEGGVVGWSLAGEGLVILSNDPSRISDIKYLCLFYPSNKNEVLSDSEIPLLVLTGEEDNVTPFSMISTTFQACKNCEVVGYKDAAHGFDIKSLTKARSMRFPPLIGRKYTFEYNEKAAKDAKSKVIQFIKDNSK
ncbi:MAG: hypothetical protein Tsb0034_09830 [Ekhidna sp.]